MKKLLSTVLAVAVVMTMVFTMMSVSASAAEKVSLLPAAESDFQIVNGGNTGSEKMTVTKEGEGFKFVSDAGGWPQAWYMGEQGTWATANTKDADCYLNWNFTVTGGGANVIVFFAGQSPMDQTTEGTAETINYYIDPANNKLATNKVVDLVAGEYKGSLAAKDLGCGEGFIDDQGNFFVSGIKIFAVGGTVVVNELSIGPKAYDEVGASGGNAAPAATTTQAPTTAGTTVSQTTAATSATQSAKTDDASNAIVFVVVAAVAAGTVTLAASKKCKAR